MYLGDAPPRTSADAEYSAKLFVLFCSYSGQMAAFYLKFVYVRFLSCLLHFIRHFQPFV